VTPPDLRFETYARMACWRLPRKGNLSRIKRGIAIDRFRNLSRETAVSRDEFNPKCAHVDVRFRGVDLFPAEINL